MLRALLLLITLLATVLSPDAAQAAPGLDPHQLATVLATQPGAQGSASVQPPRSAPAAAESDDALDCCPGCPEAEALADDADDCCADEDCCPEGCDTCCATGGTAASGRGRAALVLRRATSPLAASRPHPLLRAPPCATGPPPTPPPIG